MSVVRAKKSEICGFADKFVNKLASNHIKTLIKKANKDLLTALLELPAIINIPRKSAINDEIISKMLTKSIRSISCL
jgi:hypothetical protein